MRPFRSLTSLTVCLSLGLLLATARGDDAKKPEADKAKESKPDKELIQGTWKATAASRDGKDRTEQELKDSPMLLKFDGDKATLTEGGEQRGGEVTFKLNTESKPRQIDVTLPDREDGTKGQVLLGIYELKGDTLKICFKRNEDGTPVRPTEFKAGEKVMTTTLERQKPADKPKE